MPQLNYSHGTILLSGLPPDVPSTLVPQGFKWDERTKNFRAPAYLYRRAQDALKTMTSVVECSVFNDSEIDSSANWRDLSLTLYPYQSAAVALWQASGHKGIIVLPTGAGKTHVAMEVIRSQSVSTLIIVPTRALLQQWLHTIKSHYSGEIDIIGDGEYILQNITVATYESAYRHMKHVGANFKLLIIDEAHHFGVGIRDEILMMSAAPLRLALTASLPTDEVHLTKLTSLVGTVVFQKSIQDLRGEYLSDFEHICLKARLSEAERLAYQASYGAYLKFTRETKSCWQDLGWQAFSRFASRSPTGRSAMRSASRARSIVGGCDQKMSLLHGLLKKHWNDQVFVFAGSTQDVYRVARRGWAYPITAGIKKAERELVLNKFSEGSIRAIASCRVLNEGIDVPAASIAIIGGTGNMREQIQRIGRVLRKSPGKKAIIYEIVVDQTFEVWKSANRNTAFS